MPRFFYLRTGQQDSQDAGHVFRKECLEHIGRKKVMPKFATQTVSHARQHSKRDSEMPPTCKDWGS